MSALGRKLRSLEGGHLAFWCPGCGEAHQVCIDPDKRPSWGYNGNADAPSFTPSVLVRSGHFARGGQPGDCWCSCDDPDLGFRCRQCHFFVTHGRILYLSDCSHALAGQTVDLPDFPCQAGQGT
jgi:hypothetical protein